jgi:hypothetical protein
MGEMQGCCRFQVSSFLREPICQSGKSPHLDPHGEIVALHIGGRDCHCNRPTRSMRPWPPAQRGEFLAQLCGDDAGLRSQLSDLLKAHEAETVDIDRPPAGPQTSFVRDAAALQPNELLLNRSRIERRVGGGGMGEVCEAVDIELKLTRRSTFN